MAVELFIETKRAGNCSPLLVEISRDASTQGFDGVPQEWRTTLCPNAVGVGGKTCRNARYEMDFDRPTGCSQNYSKCKYRGAFRE